MSIKIQYQGTNKKIVISLLNSFSEFLEKLKNSFDQLPQTFKIYFMKGEEKIWLQDDAIFLTLKKDPTSCKAFIVQ